MERVRTNKNICLNCFGDLDSARVCKSCKKKADDTPNPPHHLPKRTVLNNKYLIVKALGEGGFGITYLAWDLSQGVKVAVKEYFPSGYVNRMPKSNQVIINSKSNQAASNRGLKRFIDEAKTLAKVKNLQGIVSVKDFFSANGTAYIVMEFLDGISLKKYLQRKGGKVTCDEILSILRPVMESLISVHDLGLIHRDISPDNILITKYNEVKLIDFGAAKQSNMDGKSLSIVLKQGFAPEEQYRTHGEQGPWTDIYALGVTIYYCITGTLPPESIQRMYKDTIVRPSEKGATITASQESALMKSLAVYAKNRYRSVPQMLNGLFGLRGSRAYPVTETPYDAQTTSAPKTIAKTAAKTTAPVPRMNVAAKTTASVPPKPSPATKTPPATRMTVAAKTSAPAAQKPAKEPTIQSTKTRELLERRRELLEKKRRESATTAKATATPPPPAQKPAPKTTAPAKTEPVSAPPEPAKEPATHTQKRGGILSLFRRKRG